MAKQVGPLFFTGTVDGLIFYKLGDQYYMRSKGDYKSGKQMRKDPHYKRTMQQANRFGGAAKLVKEVYYRELPRVVRKHGLFGKLTGLVNRWLYAGKAIAEVRELLLAHCKELAATTITTPKETAATPATIATVAAPVGKVAKPEAQKVVGATPAPTRVVVLPGQGDKEQPVALKPPPAPPAKQARYLSRWKVKRNGRLHIPNPLRRSSAKARIGEPRCTVDREKEGDWVI